MSSLNFKHLVLLIGTNPLPNFVVADFFLSSGAPIEQIWLVYSEDNRIQAGTPEQADRLEQVLYKKWHAKKNNLEFPLKRVSLEDVGDGGKIRRDLRAKMTGTENWQDTTQFHLNYTGGTKAMATHVYQELENIGHGDQRPFSYLDANNFRLLLDGEGIFPQEGAEDLRAKVNLKFSELIQLHGFVRCNHDKDRDFSQDKEQFDQFIHDPDNWNRNGHYLEGYLYSIIKEKFADKLNTTNEILLNWEIKKPGCNIKSRFELDIVLMQGYQLTGISCTITGKNGGKKKVKLKGFEIIHRCRQIGGDEAKAIIVSGLNKTSTEMLQKELEYDTGGNRKNILAIGLDELKNENIYLDMIEEFIFS